MMRSVLSLSEARAHVEILTELERAIEQFDEVRLGAVHRPLLAIFPRCNCGGVLMFGPWRDGSRVVACRCGVSFWEARL